MNQPLVNASSVSIVIPAYNSSAFLTAAIESVLAQTYRDGEIEIVVVDDGSTDDTKAVCDRYPTVKYIYQRNQGYLVARNQGIDISTGRYLIFLDSDDYIFPDAIEIGIKQLQERPEAGFVFGRYIFKAINPDGTYSTQKLFAEPPPTASYATILSAQHNIQCATVIFRREAVESVGGFAPGLEDLNLWLGIARTWPIYFHDRAVSEYRYHGDNFSSKSAKMLTSTLQTLELEWDYLRQTGDLELTAAYQQGRAAWIKFYGDRLLYDAIRSAQASDSISARENLQLVLTYDPQIQWVDRETYDVAIDLLPMPQQQQLIAHRQPQPQSYPQTQCLHQLFEAQVERTPDAIAVVCEDSRSERLCQRHLTYRELNDRANQLASHLQTLNVQPEVLVGISVERSLEMAIGILGILKAGGAYVPLDPAYPPERLAYMVADSDISVLVVSKDLGAVFAEYAGTLVYLDAMAQTQFDRTNPTSAVTPDNLIYTIYTSGSTGQPKGVPISHANVGRLFAASQHWYDFDERDVWVMFHSYAFDVSVWEFWGALIHGGRLVIVPFGVSRSPQEFYELLHKERVTVLCQTPSAFRQLQRVATGDAATLKLSLRAVIFAGEALDVQSLKPWFERYGDRVPQLVNMYGPTETTVYATYHPISRADLDLQECRGSVIGRPIPDLRLHILDRDLQPVPSGVAGELYIGGAGVARDGYLRRPELNAQRFIPNPFDEPSAPVLYKTGDLASYLPNGDIEYLGRMDRQVKLRGFRIELGEIEATIAKNLAVQEAVVIIREDEPGDPRLVAYLILTTPASITISELRDSLRQQLPNYMVPSAFVCLEAMPLTPNGKLDREALPAADRTSFGLADSFVAAGTSTEAILTGIWQEILRLEHVGIEDNFFDIGGNSLLGVKAIEQIQERFQVKVPVVRLYQYFNIRLMAEYLATIVDRQPPAAVTANISTTVSQPQRQVKTTDVAVIGMVGRFPGANSIEELWANLRAGTESMTWFDEADIDPSIDPDKIASPNYIRAKGILAGAELFDANFFGINDREAQMMDPQTRIFLELAAEALENVGYLAVDGNKIGVYAGAADNTYFEKHLSCQPEILDRFGEFQTHLVNDRDYLTTRASYELNLQGPSINISTACSTSLVAIIQAYQGLLNGQCDLALAGGVAITTPQNQGYLHQEGSIFTPDGHCRPFDANAQGTLFNNGAGIVVLKRLDEAIADGDRIYTVIKGVGMNNDGADKVSFMAPSISGQMGAILQAQQAAEVHPETISYIEAHGTATALGDPIEVEALTQAFRTQTAATQFCGIGSIKGNLGHLTAAAGVAGFIKTALALYHRQLPPSINYDRPNPHINFANSPFYVNDKLVDWPSSGNTPRRAGVSSFGGGGTNAHVVLEEPPQTATSSPSRPYQLLLLSAKTETALELAASNLQQHLDRHPNLNLADVAFTLQQGRKTYAHRRFIVCQTGADEVARFKYEKLEMGAGGGNTKTEDHTSDRQRRAELATSSPATATRHSPRHTPQVVFLFPGQGAQSVNMGANLYDCEPVFRQAIDTCAEILQPILGLDLCQILYPQAEQLAASTQLLGQTRYTQPALFAIEYALAQLWQSWGVKPAAAIGHSIGEFVAACLAGVFSLADALELVAMRGKLMWDLPTGSMLSVRLPAAEIEPRLPAEIAISAINGPNLCVVSGSTPAIERLQQELEAQEIVCKLLHTSHAFHSPMMDSIVAPFAKLVAAIPLSPPQMPFVSCVSGDWITAEQAIDPHYWANHLRQPVRFAEGVRTLWQQQPNYVLLEVGPRQTLTVLARQQITDRQHQIALASLGNTSTDCADWQDLLIAIGQLWLAGVEIDWQQFYRNETRHRVPLPTYPFDRQKYWIDPPSRAQTFAPPVSTTPIPLAPYLAPAPMSLVPSLASMTEPRAVRLIPSIAEVFKDTAGVEIGTHERQATFLELGLDSLSLTQVALSLKKKFQVKVTFRQLLEDCSTLATLADSIDLQLPPDAFPAPVSVAHTPDLVPTVSVAPSPILPAPTPTHAVAFTPATTIVAPLNATADSSSSAIAAVVQQQLQIMARQLELLGGNAATSTLQVSTPVAPSEIVPATPAPSNGNGNGNGTSNNGKSPLPTPAIATPAAAGPSPGAKISKTIDTSLSPQQQTALATIIDRYVAKTKVSKQQAQEHRRYLADPRTVSGFTPLLKEMVYPIVTDRAQGSRLWDEDGNEYIDLTNGFGLNFFGWSPDFITNAIKAQLDKGMAIGPQTPLAGKAAKKIARLTGMERVAFCNTGSEAVMAALRIARTVTGKDLVAIFSGSYHGTFDEVLFRAGPNLKTFPSAPGVMASALENILVLDYDSPKSLQIIAEYADRLAAVVVEPVQSRHPHIQPHAFLHELRSLTARSEIALIIDEVITGFRVAPGGAQEHFGVKADIATYGKVVGGGMPIGILTGTSKYMDALDGGFWQFGDRSIPETGVTFFAGTFVRHPLALAAVEATLQQLEAGGAELQQSLNTKTQQIVDRLTAHFELVGAQIKIEHFSSWFYLIFDATENYGGLLFYLLRERGIHIWENRPCFLTLAHSDADIETIIWAFQICIAELQSLGFLSSSDRAIAINSNLPPQPGAKLGKDRDGNPAWFVTDPQRNGEYLQIGTALKGVMGNRIER
ncbi:type I polyketide synthase [Chamaesiphon minutus]|uniref:Amino acid adenylation enzyme/thioester reductase family protein n=1 Tax=Chamaesiphon minutus (strain ATCC 27169 / PCC 6605) TaxID=1173020 RepID=K9UGD5_CHAP6|nr:type I polyketide synthase [Chamaesiphon minutus]AFY93865.1 amino acid adenylation enzyme/thioester reductase family protein [Chamaesiphon minutus PCC 6605]